MTRINLIPPESLHPKHLMAEIHELPRVFGLVRAFHDRRATEDLSAHSKYKMGAGHVKFFYTRLGFLVDRYRALCDYAVALGWKINPVGADALTHGIPPKYLGAFHPSRTDISVNLGRLVEKNSVHYGNKEVV